MAQNLFPVQIENALTDHPGIREAAAIAVPDTKYGEVVGAWIAREPGTDVSRAEVRRAVADAMNPQVSDHLSRFELVHGDMHMRIDMCNCEWRHAIVYVDIDLSDLQNAPAWVWFVGEDDVANELPKTASGKVQKHILREWSKELAKKGLGRV